MEYVCPPGRPLKVQRPLELVRNDALVGVEPAVAVVVGVDLRAGEGGFGGFRAGRLH
jgi:hypothetical protein